MKRQPPQPWPLPLSGPGLEFLETIWLLHIITGLLIPSLWVPYWLMPNICPEYVFRRMYELIEQLGLPINPDKVVPPTTVMTCMGIRVDAYHKTISLTKEKLNELQLLCDEFVNKNRVSRRTLQSLLGKLLYMAKVLAPARAFLNRMLWYLRAQKDPLINLG